METELKIADLSDGDKELLLENLRDAVYHLASCWDALREAEGLLNGEIETDDIEVLAGDVGNPSEAYKIPLEQFQAWLEPEEKTDGSVRPAESEGQ